MIQACARAFCTESYFEILFSQVQLKTAQSVFFFKLGSYPHFTANKVSLATVGLGRFLSPHVKKGGTALLTRYYGCQEAEACHTMDSVLTVGAGAVEGIGAVSTGLEVAGAVLGRSLSDSTVKIVRHK